MTDWPPQPGTPDAHAIVIAFRDSRCQFVYKDFLGGRCFEPATEPDDPDGAPCWCKAHAAGERRKRYDLTVRREREQALRATP
jgi:hypothetical protein